MTIKELIDRLQGLEIKLGGNVKVCVYPYPRHVDQYCHIAEVSDPSETEGLVTVVLELGEIFDNQFEG